MRGRFQDQGGMFSYIHPEKRIPTNHPLRKIRELVRGVLKELNHTFRRLYSHEGRPSIPPEQLLSALILQVLYSVRSERQLMEQLDYNLLFRWFVGLSPDDPIWDPTVFTKNRERLQEAAVFEKFMTKLLKHEKVKPLLSDEHFSVDGTLIEACQWPYPLRSYQRQPCRHLRPQQRCLLQLYPLQSFSRVQTRLRRISLKQQRLRTKLQPSRRH